MKNSNFSRQFINNPQTAFSKEYLLTSGSGSFSASTIGGCNTRKYHGLFITPQVQLDDNDHVIVSSIDEKVTYKQNTYHLASHQYPNTIAPQGYQYIEDFCGNPIPKWTYQLDDCVLVKEILMPKDEDTVLIRYSVADAEEDIQLDLAPFLAFRRNHKLSKANELANKDVEEINNGIKLHLYPEYDPIYLQASHKPHFVAAPDWYYNIEYPIEQSRGYSFSEDLFVPGSLIFTLKEGDVLIVHIGLKEYNTKSLSTHFSKSLKKQPHLAIVTDCLLHAANQFLIKKDKDVFIKAGFHWFGNWGRDTFIAMPGLLLTTERYKEFKAIITSALPDLKKGLLPNVGRRENAVYNSVDASLWFIWALQQYAIYTNTQREIWDEYGDYLNQILEYYANGTRYNIKMDTDGLIYAGQEGVALTWMDAIVKSKPVTPRIGKPVEINALWYNAICFCLEVAKLADDEDFVEKWGDCPNTIAQSFMDTFWDTEKGYLADCVHLEITDWSVRPNQVFALSMPYSPVAQYARKPILDIVVAELLTNKGLRTLSPKDKNYKGVCEGGQEVRDLAYHQGTVWPWLLGHFAEAYLKEFDTDGEQTVREILIGLHDMLDGSCLYTIPEIYNGDAPHQPTGAVAQAWSVAELMRIEYLLANFNKKEKNSKGEKV